ncbi:hypothetical protein EJB05_31318, partial [Eragrostis curvula]
MGFKYPADDLSSLATSASSFPLLVYDYDEEPDSTQTVISVADRSSRTYHVPELRSCRYLETPSGLLLMVNSASLQSSLWNPQTGERIALPPMDKALPEHCECLLSDAVSSPNCIVLIYDLGQPDLLFCKVNGGSAWASHSCDFGPRAVPVSPSAPKPMDFTTMAAVQGKFYYIKSRDVIGVLSFAHQPEPEPRLEEITTFDATMPTIKSDAPLVLTIRFLLESCNELFLVCLFLVSTNFERIEEVGSYRMDFARREWCKVTDIGDRAFLVGPGNFGASCAAAEHGLKRGCVYFSYDFLGGTFNYHIFDLVEGTREIAGPPTQGTIPVACREPFWMVPVLPQSFFFFFGVNCEDCIYDHEATGLSGNWEWYSL